LAGLWARTGAVHGVVFTPGMEAPPPYILLRCSTSLQQHF